MQIIYAGRGDSISIHIVCDMIIFLMLQMSLKLILQKHICLPIGFITFTRLFNTKGLLDNNSLLWAPNIQLCTWITPKRESKLQLLPHFGYYVV